MTKITSPTRTSPSPSGEAAYWEPAVPPPGLPMATMKRAVGPGNLPEGKPVTRPATKPTPSTLLQSRGRNTMDSKAERTPAKTTAKKIAGPSNKDPKSKTGISGFDEVTGGGIPRGRTTAIYGGPGVGKTVFALHCLAHAARKGEPGVFLSFGESATETRENGKTLGLGLEELEAAGKLVIDSALVDPEEITPTGGFTLDGVFVRLEQAIEQIGATHVIIDAINVVGQTIPHPAALRADLRRMLNGLKRRGVTTLVTVEGVQMDEMRVEEYLADCVIHLRNTVEKGIATRLLRVVKYRGSSHRANEYPFVISNQGITLTPLTEKMLDHPSSRRRISMGIEGLDSMLGGGIFQGDTVFVTGTAGSGKTSFTVCIAVAACKRREKCLFVALEEPASQVIRNMKAIGLDFAKWMKAGLLRVASPKPSLEGLEAHLAFIMEAVESFRPNVVVVDPLTPLMALGQSDDARETIIRLLNLIKARGVTVACTLLARERYLEEQNTPFASFVDNIVLLSNLEEDGQRHRTLSVLKARGIAHSTEVREFHFSRNGVKVGKKRATRDVDKGAQR